ncbi:MAG: clan AA aspartic protease, partial [Rhodospirillales bacterium]|nr:clan AA aspartic protease [Rhodospirillales bacterium]
AAFDIAVDDAARLIRLYDVRGCRGNFLPAADGYRPVPVTMPANTALVLPVVLDGVTMRALLDTGASASLIAAPGMIRLGFPLDGPARAPGPGRTVAGLGPATVTVSDRRIGHMQVGPATDADVTLLMAPLHLVPAVDMLLGADWLRGRRIWLSFATRQVFLAD